MQSLQDALNGGGDGNDPIGLTRDRCSLVMSKGLQ